MTELTSEDAVGLQLRLEHHNREAELKRRTRAAASNAVFGGALGAFILFTWVMLLWDILRRGGELDGVFWTVSFGSALLIGNSHRSIRKWRREKAELAELQENHPDPSES